MEKNSDLRAGGITLHSSVHELRFWQNLSLLRRMVRHLGEREHLIGMLATDPVLPEKTRDEAVSLLKMEQAENLSAFHDFLSNFIAMGMQGLHRTEITLEFSFQDDGSYCVLAAALHVDGKAVPLPPGEGQRLISLLSPVFSSGEPEQALLRYYRSVEEMHDRAGGTSLSSCLLELSREIFPGRSFHARLRLPAHLFCGDCQSGNGDEEQPSGKE